MATAWNPNKTSDFEGRRVAHDRFAKGKPMVPAHGAARNREIFVFLTRGWKPPIQAHPGNRNAHPRLDGRRSVTDSGPASMRQKARPPAPSACTIAARTTDACVMATV